MRGNVWTTLPNGWWMAKGRNDPFTPAFMYTQHVCICAKYQVGLLANILILPARCQLILRMGGPAHILTVLSLPPLTILSATKSTQYTSSVCPGRSILILYVFRSQSYPSASHLIIPVARPTFSVESLLAETSILLSALQATRYTAATWPLRLATNLPVRPSHNLTALSNPALAIHLPSGEKSTWLTCF